MLSKKLKEEEERFFIKYEVPGFETFVEVKDNFTCKSYYTVYNPIEATESLEDLEVMAEEEAINQYVKQFNWR